MELMVIGHPQAVLGFSLVGVHGQAATTASEVNEALDKAFSTPEIGIILVTEDAARLIRGKIDTLKLRSTIPLVVEIPGPGASESQRPMLNEVVFKAIGIKL